MRLPDLRDCFEGVIPSVIATLDADGLPNASYLSQVFLVDENRLALSNQFFSKTVANVRQTGRAALLMVDGRTGQQYVLDLAFDRSVEAGELFERMDAHLKALSARHGAMAEVMRLRGADVYRVENLRLTPSFADAPTIEPAPSGRHLAAAGRVVDALAAQSDPDAALDVALERLDAELGFAHAMILALDDADDGSEARLAVLASRGYPAGGVGSEVPVGVGAIGIAAQTGRPVRIADLSRGQRMAGAALSQAELDDLRVIPLPGLPDPLSQLAAPMIAGGKVRGVIFAEAATRFAFAPEDEQALALVAALLASQLAAGADRQPEPLQASVSRQDRPFKVRYYAFDDSVFIDEAYLIKGVPGRLLHHFLRTWLDEGRGDFSNREVRLDARLRLPDLKDNLETRLILLKRRLDEKAAPIRLSRPGRGLIRLEVAGTPTIEVIEP